jgi:hypothetical protein
MNQAEVSDLVCVGLHDTNDDEQSYATEYPEMNQDPSRETIKFEVSMETPAMHSVFSNSNACLDGYQHTGIMAGSQAVEEVRFGIMQHLEVQPHMHIVNICLLMQLIIPFLCNDLFLLTVHCLFNQGRVSDSDEESLSTSPEISDYGTPCSMVNS